MYGSGYLHQKSKQPLLPSPGFDVMEEVVPALVDLQQ